MYNCRMRLCALGGLLCALLAAVPGTALAGWGTPEPVGTNINEVLLAPGGQGFVVGFPASSPSRLRFALRPFAGPLESPLEFPAEIGQHTLPAWGFDVAGDAVILDEEVQRVAWRSANGEVSTTQTFTGHLLARWPRLVSVAPSGDALIGVNEVRPGGSPVQLAFRPAGKSSQVDTENTVDLTNNGTLFGVQLQADGGAIAVYWDEATEKLMQVVRPSGSSSFNTPTVVDASASNSVVSFSGDPSGWAMIAWVKAGQVFASVRAPDGSFPAGTLVGSGPNDTNATAAVTSSGDGLVSWWQTGLGNPSCPATAIEGAIQHHGTWAAEGALGPAAWPDVTGLAYAATAFSAGNDVSVPMLQIHREGSPCPTGAQARALIVHHFRSGASGLTDQGTSALAPLSSNLNQLVSGWAMEPAGKILAWYRIGEERFLRTFDGVTPGGGTPSEPPGGEVPHETPVSKTSVTTGGGLVSAIPTIKPLVLQQFASIPTIDPKALEFEMHCPPPTLEQNGDQGETCAGRAYGMYLFTGKQIKAYGASSTAVKKRLDVIATGSLTLKAGHNGRLKLHTNRLGKALLRTGKKLKITLKLTVTVGARSVTGNLPATIKARKKH
jgi:hypothetical protein